MRTNVVILVACLFFAGSCATKTGTGPAAPGHGSMPTVEEPKGAGTVSGAGPGAGDTRIARLEDELRRALAGSEAAWLKRERDMLVLTFRSDGMFGFDSAAVKSGPRAEIRRIAGILSRYPETRIRIEVHTDSIGAAEANQKLSERRAVAVRDELAGRSLKTDRIEVVGFGAAKPVASNRTPAGRRQNRRVQVFIKSAVER